jgi:superfamily II DNA helicase RecQ
LRELYSSDEETGKAISQQTNKQTDEIILCQFNQEVTFGIGAVLTNRRINTVIEWLSEKIIKNKISPMKTLKCAR